MKGAPMYLAIGSVCSLGPDLQDWPPRRLEQIRRFHALDLPSSDKLFRCIFAWWSFPDCNHYLSGVRCYFGGDCRLHEEPMKLDPTIELQLDAGHSRRFERKALLLCVPQLPKEPT